jgi:hypothetical protein
MSRYSRVELQLHLGLVLLEVLGLIAGASGQQGRIGAIIDHARPSVVSWDSPGGVASRAPSETLTKRIRCSGQGPYRSSAALCDVGDVALVPAKSYSGPALVQLEHHPVAVTFASTDAAATHAATVALHTGEGRAGACPAPGSRR